MNSDRLWITWETQRRNRSMSKAVGARLCEWDIPGGRITRYFRLIVRSIVEVSRAKPSVVFVQNPSLVLAALGIIIGRLRGLVTVVDAHNGGLYPREGNSQVLNRVARMLVRSAPLTIVTNPSLAEHVRAMGGRPVVVPDPLPKLAPRCVSNREKKSFDVVFVCTWAEDEPFIEVIHAAELLPEDVILYITGNSRGRDREYGRPLPSNVVLTGFLDDQDYLSLLYASDLIVDLTTRQDCLVCGAYESVAANKPMILSDTPATRAYFDRGVIYTNNSANDIARAIIQARNNALSLTAEVKLLRQEIVHREALALRRLEEEIDALVRVSPDLEWIRR